LSIDQLCHQERVETREKPPQTTKKKVIEYHLGSTLTIVPIIQVIAKKIPTMLPFCELSHKSTG